MNPYSFFFNSRTFCLFFGNPCHSIKVTPDVVINNGPGRAKADESENHLFWYVDRWSSPYTWGCVDESCKPKAGEIIVIPAGQVILLDETTPILARDQKFCIKNIQK